MTFKELREQSGMNKTQFAEYFEIPYRTVQNWEAGVNKCPDYLLKLLQYKLDTEKTVHEEGFVTVSKHYGFAFEYVENFQEHAWVIRRIKNGMPGIYVTARRNKEDAVKECEYLEKLNFAD